MVARGTMVTEDKQPTPTPTIPPNLPSGYGRGDPQLARPLNLPPPGLGLDLETLHNLNLCRHAFSTGPINLDIRPSLSYLPPTNEVAGRECFHRCLSVSVHWGSWVSLVPYPFPGGVISGCGFGLWSIPWILPPRPYPQPPPWVWAWRPLPQPDPSTSPWVWAWRHPLVNRMTDTCKNITFANFVCGR